MKSSCGWASLCISVLLPLLLEGLDVVTATTGDSQQSGEPPAEALSWGDFPSLSSASSFGHKMLPAFMLAPGFTNLNHGSFGACPREVLSAQQQYVSMAEARPDQWFRNDFYTILDQVRSRLAAYMGVEDEEEVVLVENASSGVNGLLRSLPLKRGDRVLVFNTAYGMVKHTIEWLSATMGVVGVTVNVRFPLSGDDSFITPLQETLEALGQGGVRLVVMSHVSSLPAVLLPVEALVRLCRDYGVGDVMIDGAHALGSLPHLNVTALGADYWVGNGHKWLYSPKGSAVLYVAKHKQAALYPQPTVISSRGDPTFVGRYAYVGTRDYTAHAAMHQALDFRQSLGGDAHITRYLRDLAVWGGQYLAKLWGTSILQPTHMTVCMTNVVLPVGGNGPLGQALQKELSETHDIYIVVATLEPSMTPAGHKGPIVFTRLSTQIYLQQSDFVRLGSLVLQLLKNTTFLSLTSLVHTTSLPQAQVLTEAQQGQGAQARVG